MNVLRIAGWSLLIGLGAAVVVQARVMAANRRRIDQLETRLGEMSEVNAVLARARQDSDQKRRHLRLLALLPPALWVAATASRKPAIAGAIAASVFAAGAVQLDTLAPHREMLPKAEAGTTAPPEPPPPVELRDQPVATRATTTTTTTTVPAAAPPARLNETPATTTTSTVPATTTTTVPASTTTTLLPGTTILEDGCVVGADRPLGLPVQAGVLCPGSG